MTASRSSQGQVAFPPGPNPEATDGELFAATARGDQRALEAILARHRSAIYATAERVLCNASDSEEVVQEVAVSIWRSAAGYDSNKGTASAWLARIARYKAIDRLRSRKSQEAAIERYGAEREHEDSPVVDLLPIEQSEALAALLRMIEALEPIYRRVADLVLVRGVSCREAARMTGVSAGVMRMQLTRARARLRDMVSGVPKSKPCSSPARGKSRGSAPCAAPKRPRGRPRTLPVREPEASASRRSPGRPAAREPRPHAAFNSKLGKWCARIRWPRNQQQHVGLSATREDALQLAVDAISRLGVQ